MYPSPEYLPGDFFTPVTVIEKLFCFPAVFIVYIKKLLFCALYSETR
ncbi:hypothetical protein [Morganella morganii IS15]|nr:hypothetical protein CSB69_0217 [Morganella morganii]EMP52100.1 hypothetical protein C790_00570 [Morganella morganii SC01]CDK65082.1 hypothetical protein [Morganella morganii IS15]